VTFQCKRDFLDEAICDVSLTLPIRLIYNFVALVFGVDDFTHYAICVLIDIRIRRLLYLRCFGLQLGYDVGCGSSLTSSSPGFCFHVMSSSNSVSAIQRSILEFICSVPQRLDKYSDSSFEAERSSLIQLLKKPAVSLSESARDAWVEIVENRYDFRVKEKIVGVVEKIVKSDLVHFYTRYFLNGRDSKVLIVQSATELDLSTGIHNNPTGAGSMFVDDLLSQSRPGWTHDIVHFLGKGVSVEVDI